jgi:ribosomal protein S18 acetylase RimI-like enzyme
MNISVRKARLTDISFIRRLACESVIYGIPHTRTVDPEEVRRSTREALKTLEIDFKMRKDFEIFVAEDLDANKPVGYLMLDLVQVERSTGEHQSLIHDIAVRREYWGKYVVHKLVAAAKKMTHERGLKYMVGEITSSNRRTVVQAQRLGFEIERYQIVMKCDSSTKERDPDSHQETDRQRTLE